MKRKTRKSVDPRFAAFCRKVCLPVPGRLPRANPPNSVVRRASAHRNPNVRYWESRQAGPGHESSLLSETSPSHVIRAFFGASDAAPYAFGLRTR